MALGQCLAGLVRDLGLKKNRFTNDKRMNCHVPDLLCAGALVGALRHGLCSRGRKGAKMPLIRGRQFRYTTGSRAHDAAGRAASGAGR